MNDEKNGCGILVVLAIVLGWLAVGLILVALFIWEITPPHVRPVVAILTGIAVVLNAMRGWKSE